MTEMQNDHVITPQMGRIAVGGMTRGGKSITSTGQSDLGI